MLGITARTQKNIYRRALIDSRFYEIEFYLCKKADSRIFNYTVNTPVVANQLQSPITVCAFDNHCQNVILVTPPNNDTRMAFNNNTNITSEPHTKFKIPDIPLAVTTTYNNQRSSSQLPFINSAVNHQCQSIVSFTPPCIDTGNTFNDRTSTSTILLPKK